MKKTWHLHDAKSFLVYGFYECGNRSAALAAQQWKPTPILAAVFNGIIYWSSFQCHNQSVLLQLKVGFNASNCKVLFHFDADPFSQRIDSNWIFPVNTAFCVLWYQQIRVRVISYLIKNPPSVALKLFQRLL